MCHIERVALAVFVAVFVLLTASTAHPAIKVTCVDGNAQAVLKAPGQPPEPVDWVTCDTVVDGTCNFTIERGGCGCAPKGCCGFVEAAVPVRRQGIVLQAFGFKLRLRCRSCPVPSPGPTA